MPTDGPKTERDGPSQDGCLPVRSDTRACRGDCSGRRGSPSDFRRALKRRLGYGVPEEWLDDVRAVSDEDTLLELARHLPVEASDALLELATGGTPALPAVDTESIDPFEHPDARRRFHVVVEGGDESVAEFLEQPLSVWRFFLHPSQRSVVENNWRGPFRAVGAPGTGKTGVQCTGVSSSRARPRSEGLVYHLRQVFGPGHIDELGSLFEERCGSLWVVDLDTLVAGAPRLGERGGSSARIWGL